VARRSKPKDGRGQKKGRSKRAAERTITHLLNHPVRLDAYLATFEAMASPIEVSRLLRKPISDVSFHMGELRKEGVIELVKRAQRRGAIEHYYKASKPPEIDEEEWQAMPKSSRRRIVALGLQVVIADALSALRHGKLEDDDDMYLVWMPLRLSPEGQDATTALQAEMLERMTAIKEKHGLKDGEETSQAMKVAVMLWFERGVPGLRRPRDISDISDLDEG
jgi:DNA-binding transcriptional ArsR family regulator